MNDHCQKIRVLIVDDSPFSRRLITESLDPAWFEIVGFADGFRSALESYRTYMPDVVTIDIVMPEMDGLEVARRIVAEEPGAQIMIVSNASGDEQIGMVKANRTVKFLQKPFNSAEIMSALRSVCDADLVDGVFQSGYPAEFVAALNNFMKRFATDISSQPIADGIRLKSSGVAAIVGITGHYSGRMVFDLSEATARKLAARLLKQEPKDAEQINDIVAEFANIVAGHASSNLNKKFRGAFLRVSPPAVFVGDNFSISSPSLDIHAWEFDTPFGEAMLSIGFKKEGV